MASALPRRTLGRTGIPVSALGFGSAPLGIATRDYESRLATWREWEHVARQAQG